MNDKEQILKMAEKYDVITFDVFDTLIIRDVLKPVDVYRFCYGSLGRYFRSGAEIIAGRRSKNGEVTLDDIEHNCIFSCKKEIGFEKGICRANPEMYSVYTRLKEQGKKICAISDMYLSNAAISELLNNAGYDIPVMVSSEYGCNKSSGKLFEEFLKKHGLKASQVLHIGDNKEADIKGAEKAGINAIQINKHENILSYTKYSRKNYELAAFINHGLHLTDDPVERIGYEIVGPIIMSFCQWTHEKFTEEKFDRLYFLARDMHFIYDIYKTVYQDDVHYLRVSRKSLRSARNAPETICEYLKKEGCFGNCAIVDTGWIGVAQPEIERYAKEIDPATDLGGLYLGTKLAYRAKKRSERSHACLYSSFWEQACCEIKAAFLETLIGTNEQQVIAYEKGVPIFDREENRDDTNKLKCGARRFVSDWVKLKGNKKILPKQARQGFERLFYFPTEQHMELLGGLLYEDVKDTKIISYKEGFPYWKHPGKWLSDLGYSAWKGAFFKKSGVLAPLFLMGYFIFGNARIFLVDLMRALKNEI
ncbi:MAG: HAD-IA family hydrolase [Oscillospiraceae bacterium]|nr:HAD-IA family hydrolase [Oscillospiraceae bacterium]